MKTNSFFVWQVGSVLGNMDIETFPVSFDWSEWTGEKDKNLLGDYPRNVECIIASHKGDDYVLRGVRLTNGMHVVEEFDYEEKTRTAILVKNKYAFTGFFDLEEIDWEYYPPTTPPPEEGPLFDTADEV